MVNNILTEYAQLLDDLEKNSLTLAKEIVPVVKAYPETTKRMQQIEISPEIPIIDIIAENSWVTNKGDIAHIKRVHEGFVADSPMRETILAKDSGHHVMIDRPELVLEAISKMIDHLKTKTKD
jgi:hypothetical protein